VAAEADPARLVRDSAGSYHSADDRFTVRNEGGTWYAEDSAQLDELGLAHLLGPFRSLTDAKAEMTDARGRKVAARKPRQAKRRPTPDKSKPPERDWTEVLPADERATARRMAKLLDERGIADAREIVIADVLGLLPRVATALIRARVTGEAIDAWDDDTVRAVAAELGTGDITTLAQAVARRTVERVYAVLDGGEAGGRDDGLPGWQLTDTPGGRRMRLTPDR
jgi:hypothetical protein